MKTLLTALRVADLASLDFCLTLGYDEVGRVDVGCFCLTLGHPPMCGGYGGSEI